MKLELILGLEIMKNRKPLLVMLVVTAHRKPSTSDGHNFFVRTLFQMFLDSMESPLNPESIHI